LKMEYGYNDRGIPTEVRVNLRWTPKALTRQRTQRRSAVSRLDVR
jgi:hypothetical protein